jgi:hypothetical protein
MIYRNFKWASAFFIILLFFTCKDTESPEIEIVIDSQIVGTWDWIETCSGDWGCYSNEDFPDFSLRVIFKKNGVYKEYRNDSLTVISKYRIELKPFGENSEEREFLQNENNLIEQLIEYEDDYNKITLIDMSADRGTSKYLRADVD